MSYPRVIRCLATVLFFLSTTLPLFSQVTHGDSQDRIFWMKTPMPLGAEQITLKPSGQKILLLGCIEDPRFNQLKISRVRESPFVMDATGSIWKNYPSQVTFRVTVSAIDPNIMEVDSDSIEESGDLNSFLLGLHFRLKSFRGLHMTELQPDSVKLIGVPSDVPYKERVYRVLFNTGDFPVHDRLVMEVLSPKGQLLTRFHLELE
ncbi:MAG TPA: hypothetical protein VFU86_03155 [Terriglobales bacterium]|nr:hypothetical protein [Terriglobales bacterium]